MLNHIVLMGRLTKDPELRHTAAGTAVASFCLAVDQDRKDKDSGNRNTDFIDIVAWGKSAEFVSKYFAKGRMAAVSGRLQIRKWTDKDGNNRYSAEVVAESVYFADSKKDDGAAYAPAPEQNYAAEVLGRHGIEPDGGFPVLEDDDGRLPF